MELEFNAARGHAMEKYLDELKEIDQNKKRNSRKRPASGTSTYEKLSSQLSSLTKKR